MFYVGMFTKLNRAKKTVFKVTTCTNQQFHQLKAVSSDCVRSNVVHQKLATLYLQCWNDMEGQDGVRLRGLNCDWKKAQANETIVYLVLSHPKMDLCKALCIVQLNAYWRDPLQAIASSFGWCK